MGIETALLIATIGSGLLAADAAIGQAENDAQAVVDRANIDSENKSRETQLRAARQQVSFLNSGITLTGDEDTPMSVIQDTFKFGIEDINQITTNANKQSKNIIKAGRSEAIGTLVSTGVSAFGGMSTGGGSANSAFSGGFSGGSFTSGTAPSGDFARKIGGN